MYIIVFVFFLIPNLIAADEVGLGFKKKNDNDVYNS